MSCDRQRAYFFNQVEPQLAAAFGGRLGPTSAALELIFDVVRHQPPPRDPEERQRIEAATRRAIAVAREGGVDLYPHKSQTGLPKPEIQAAWCAIMDTLDAVQRGEALPPVAAEVQQSQGFQQIVEPRFGGAGGGGGWDTPTSPALRLAFRRAWASQPELVAALLRADWPVLGSEECAPFLRSLCAQLAADPKVPPLVAGGARQYLALDEEAMLGPQERVAWAQFLGGVAGVGARMNGQYAACGKCGGPHAASYHRCNPAEVKGYLAVSQAVLAVLADPEYVEVATMNSPRSQMDVLLEQVNKKGPPDPFTGPLAALWEVAREEDRRMMAWLVDAARKDHRLYGTRDVTMATMREPIMLGTRALVWDNGRLYDEDWYRENAEWHSRSAPQTMLLRLGNRTREEGVVAYINERDLLDLMNGRPVPHTVVEWTPKELSKRYPLIPTSAKQLQAGNIFRRPCGCLFRCDSPDESWRARDGWLKVVHIYEGSTCYEHRGPSPVLQMPDEPVERVSFEKIRYSFPRWGATAPNVRELTPEDSVGYRTPDNDRRVVGRG